MSCAKSSESQLYPYQGRAYSRVEGKSLESLVAELQAVFDAYPEYSDPARGPACFDTMVKLFAGDDYYNLHFVAVHYLKLKEALPA